MNSTSNLCRRRKIKTLDIQTPLLIPSFSSKNFSDLGETWEYLRELVRDVVLFSAYDLYYGYIHLPNQGTDILFIDSGGYEARIEDDLSETMQRPYLPKEWDSEKHHLALEKIDTLSALVLVSFDNPNQDILTQIYQANEFFSKYPTCATDFLLKPYQTSFIDPEQIAKSSKEFDKFDILGVTEKELGDTILNRVSNLINLRKVLNQNGIDIPIHIFGCLDQISVWLYFLCGADIFDGLTWLRFVFHEDMPIYRNSWAIKNGLLSYNDTNLKALGWQNNLAILKEQQASMSKFASKPDMKLIPKDLESLIQFLGLYRD